MSNLTREGKVCKFVNIAELVGNTDMKWVVGLFAIAKPKSIFWTCYQPKRLWRSLFCQEKKKNHYRGCLGILDYCLALTTFRNSPNFGAKPFKFFNYWVDHANFVDWVQEA